MIEDFIRVTSEVKDSLRVEVLLAVIGGGFRSGMQWNFQVTYC